MNGWKWFNKLFLGVDPHQQRRNTNLGRAEGSIRREAGHDEVICYELLPLRDRIPESFGTRRADVELKRNHFVPAEHA